MLLELTDKVVVITGAARGIGRTITEAFLRERSRVVALDLDVGALDWFQTAREEAGLTGAAYACDVSDTASVTDVIARVVAELGRIDVVVNNAGVMGEGLVTEIDVRPSAWVDAACRAANRDLTADESAQLRPGEPTRPTCPA
jgi:3-oxoacyl-[acyl-carrier protein] reductase